MLKQADFTLEFMPSRPLDSMETGDVRENLPSKTERAAASSQGKRNRPSWTLVFTKAVFCVTEHARLTCIIFTVSMWIIVCYGLYEWIPVPDTP